MRIGYLIAAIVVGILLILALQYRDVWFSGLGWFSTPAPAIEPEVTIQPRAEAEVPERVQPAQPSSDLTAQAPVVPSLAESDEYMRDLLLQFPAPAAWTELPDLARRLAVVLSSAARGVLPRSQLGFLQPQSTFPAEPIGEDGKSYILDAEGFSRFRPVVEVLTALPAETMAQIFVASEPLLDAATAELGEGESVRELLNRALDEVLTTPVLTAPIVLKRPGLLYEYADAQLEARSDLQKQLLRMGPDALLELQNYAQAVVDALNLSAKEGSPEQADGPTTEQP